jgi:hypothetical protein
MIDAAGKIPASLDAVTTVDHISLAFWSYRASNTEVGWLPKEFPADLGLQPAAKNGDP